MSISRVRTISVAGLSALALTLPLVATAPADAAQAPGDAQKGRWTVLSGQDGSTLLWDSRGAVPFGDARPEFTLDGAPLGTPLGGVNGSPYRLVVPGLHDVRIASLGVTLGDRPVGSTSSRSASPSARSSSATGVTPPQPSTLVSPDPGAPGSYRTTAYSYHLPDLRIEGLPTPVEVLGQVVAPVGAPGRRPVVLFLHGRHGTCFSGTDVTIDWPCAPGYQAIPSLQGYRYLQSLLASRGYVTVSIAANGINGQDGEQPDSGAHARSVLIRKHLTQLANWSVKAGPGAVAGLNGHADLQKVLLVGHSRGGEGVARAAIDVVAADPFRIAGQVLIAPTDFGRQVAVGTPTTVLLPYCDGDVSDLQGQQYVDQARGLATGDRSLVTSAMVFGADHNFFNSEWTPGTAKAPANDDWYDDADPVCGARAAGRLTAAGQRSAGAAYVSAAAATYLSQSTTAVALLDGSKVRAASAGKAVVLTQAIGGTRTLLLGDATGVTPARSGAITAAPCAGFTGDGSPACAPDGSGQSPHWLQGPLPSPTALRVAWTAAGATATVKLPAPLDVRGSTSLDARVITDPSTSSGLGLVLTDTAGHSAVVSGGTLVPLPGTPEVRKLWATTVRVPLSAFKGVDLAHVRSLGVRSTSRTGTVYVVDALTSSPGQVSNTVTPRTVPRFEVSSPAIHLPGDDQTHDVPVTVKVIGTVRVPAKLWVVTEGSSESPDGNPQSQVVTVKPGARSLVVHVPVMSSSVWSPYPDRVVVTAFALKDAVVGSYVGLGLVTSDVQPPTMRALDPSVETTQGTPVRWTLRLSAPTRYGFYDNADAVVPGPGTELTTQDVLHAWVLDHVQSPTLPDGRPAPLSQSAASTFIGFDALSTTYTFELPLAATSTSKVDRVVAFEIAADGQVLTQPLRLTAVVHPKA